MRRDGAELRFLEKEIKKDEIPMLDIGDSRRFRSPGR